MECSECSAYYHIGTVCSGISESTYQSKGKDYRKSWRCLSCRKGKAGQSSSVPKETDGKIATMLVEISRKLDELLPLKQTVNDIEESMSVLSTKYDKILETVAKHDNELKALKNRVCKLEEPNLSAELLSVRSSVNELEYHSRKLNIEVHGVKQDNNECLIDKMNAIASKLQLAPLTEQTVTSIHRLQTRSEKPPGIIIRFSNQSTREQWLNKKKALSVAQHGMFITENLTAQNRMLLKAAKEWARVNNFRFAWHRAGKVFIRKSEGDRAHLIKSPADLDKIVSRA